MFHNRVGMEVSLEDASKQLGVERRRIYDIVNVFESIGVMVRMAKSRYVWFGPSKLEQKLDELKKEALRNRMPRYLGKHASSSSEDPEDSRPPSQCDPRTHSSTQRDDPQLQSKELVALVSISSTEQRRETSLTVLSVRFVQLFLLADNSIVSLDEV